MEAISRTAFLVGPLDPAVVEGIAAFRRATIGGEGGPHAAVEAEDRLRRLLRAANVPAHELSWTTFKTWLDLRRHDAAIRSAMDGDVLMERTQFERLLATAGTTDLAEWAARQPDWSYALWLSENV